MIKLKQKKPKILVIGDLIVDHYLWGSSNRISPEAPVQIINVDDESNLLGGAGNVLNNLNSLDAEVDLISVVGMCETSQVLKDLLIDIGINLKYLVTQEDRISSKKSRIIAAQQQVVRYDKESSDEINESSQKAILNNFKSIITKYDIVLLSDYGKGVLTPNLTKKLISISNKNNIKVLVDPKGLDYSKYEGAFLLTPNKQEAGEATHSIINDETTLANAIQMLKEKYKLAVSLITLSEEGVAIFDRKLRIHPTQAREVFDVTGAGDTILASLGFALSCNEDIDEAVKFANLAAGVVVGKIGSATATFDEISDYESKLNKSSSENHIKSIKEIAHLIEKLKNKNKKIIFTNGCFDILHVGHIKYLEEAKSFGDILVLGLNSDKSVKNIKGEERPINNQYDRAHLLASIEVVDFVVIFDEDTPLNLINIIKPHILVKGADYEGKEVVGQHIANELKLVKYIDKKSTTNTIRRIQNL
jgi:D-beta-D-heptose 7-phosphate kinase / D-beta-D-heptose 1-phosphate adenosyltransferase